ncbi:MAG: hypothetical protein FJX67_08380 [Alphaproteobacteria bacterium]|nr:hypothetical protein [Alphaproteobacteria bacterium]
MAAYDAGDFADAYVRLRERADIAPLTGDVELLDAWTHTRLGLIEEGAAIFERRYRDNQDEQSAEGLLVVAMETRDFARPQRIARASGGPLAAIADPALANRGALPKRLERIEADYLATWLDSVDAARDPLLPVRLANRLAPGVLERRDAPMAVRLGWRAYERGAYAYARRWFAAALG